MLETPFVAEQYVLLLEDCSPKIVQFVKTRRSHHHVVAWNEQTPHWLQSNRRLGLLQTGLQCLSDHCNSSHQILHVILFFSSFIHSGYFYSTSSKSTTTQRRCRHSTDTVSEFHAEAPQATASEGLAQGPYVAARAEGPQLVLECQIVHAYQCKVSEAVRNSYPRKISTTFESSTARTLRSHSMHSICRCYVCLSCNLASTTASNCCSFRLGLQTAMLF